MIPSLTEDVMKESLRLSNLFSVTGEQQELWAELSIRLKNAGYGVKEVTERWFYVTSGDKTLQLEIDPKGSNLDMVVLDYYTASLGNSFPLGGSWAETSSVKLIPGNLNFALKRIETMFTK